MRIGVVILTGWVSMGQSGGAGNLGIRNSDGGQRKEGKEDTESRGQGSRLPI